jgi:hypothetical protein
MVGNVKSATLDAYTNINKLLIFKKQVELQYFQNIVTQKNDIEKWTIHNVCAIDPINPEESRLKVAYIAITGSIINETFSWHKIDGNKMIVAREESVLQSEYGGARKQRTTKPRRKTPMNKPRAM